MPVDNGKPNFLISKLSGLLLIVIGFLLAASGYRADSTGYIIAGVIILAVGIALIVSKVIRRNPGNAMAAMAIEICSAVVACAHR